ncbi:PHD finger protein 21A [Bagarius yarrelli]|uniref:PHD finger protein 21A n=1 Tax=Bagarius yarrelli TaxID=175774 RepID=A0A556VBY6_BAGYA|nr:PHD finger protein 21A [Bagarius yarrelli]
MMRFGKNAGGAIRQLLPVSTEKKVVEQLRRDLLVKQDSAEIKLQTHTQLPLQADGKTTTLISNQNQSSLPPPHLNTPQNSVSVTPVIASKSLPLVLRAATPTTPIAMMPTSTIAMVTTLTNTPRPSLSKSDLQNSPVGLQTASKPANQGVEPVRIVPKNTIVVMPKTSVAPAALQPILASSQQPVLLTAKLSSALLPSTGPVHQLHIFSPQPGNANTPPGTTNATQPCPSSAQAGFNIIQPCPSITMTLSTNLSQFSTSSTKHNAQFPSILISPHPSKPHPVPYAQANTDSENTGTPHTVQSAESCPNTPKLAFMLSLGLVTHDYLKEIQSKRQERKRRTTANPVYSGAVFEPERKKSTVPYLNSAAQEYSKGGHSTKFSRVVERGVSPLSPTSLHPACVGPYFSVFPHFHSSHPSPSSTRLSLSSVLKNDEVIEWPGTLAIVHSYISYKAEREQEKQRLEKWSSELQQEREELELKAKQLSDSIMICTESRNGVLARQREMEASIEKVKDLVRLIRGIQLPSLPQFLAIGITNENPGTILTQQPITTLSSNENQHPYRKNSFSSLSDLGNTVTDHRDYSHLHKAPTNTNSNISSMERSEDNSEVKNTSIYPHGFITNNSPTVSNTHSQSTMCASSNGTLEPEDGHEKSTNQNMASDKGCMGDINKNSIRDLREGVEPSLSTVMPMSEVVHSIK